MFTIRCRLDAIDALRQAQMDQFTRAETAAFHGRKILEAVAFGCLVALENGIKHIPRDAKGQWNAEVIFNSLRRKRIVTLPSPSVFRAASREEAETSNVKATIVGVVERRMTHDELITSYQGMHRWLHELNPYTQDNRTTFCSKHEVVLWRDLERLKRFVEVHVISISGQGFFCTLKDSVDGQTKVVPISRAI